MRSVILHILCEGPTEERFVKKILAPYLRPLNIFPKAVLLLTSKKKNARGGMISYAQARRDMEILMKQNRDNQSEFHIYTTMFDYYALPNDFPGFEDAQTIHDARLRIDSLEKSLAEAVGRDRFIPYIQLHEFESLLFTDISVLKQFYPRASSAIDRLKSETDLYEDPEMINNGPDTAPSKRIIKALDRTYNYDKVESGAAAANLIGLDAILARCPHFGAWVGKIKSLSAELNK